MALKKNVTFGELIRFYREESNLPLRVVAKFLSIDHSLLGKIERNERHPTKEFISKIATYYKVDINDLNKAYLSDQIAYKILDEVQNIEILKVAENKIKYLTKHNK